MSIAQRHAYLPPEDFLRGENGAPQKREAYLTIPSLRVLALVETDTMAVTLWRRTGESWTQEYASAAEQVLIFPEIECELPLAEIYEGSALITS